PASTPVHSLSHSGSGALNLSGNINIPGSFTNSSGIFNAGSNTMTVCGDFTNNGTFNAGTGTVIFDDAAIVSHVHGTTFNNLSITAPGKQLVVDAGMTEIITGDFVLTGTALQNIYLTSSVGGSAWNINPQGLRNVNYVTAKDVANINSIPILAYNFTSLGNTPGWNNYVAPPLPPPLPHNVPGGNVLYRDPFAQLILMEEMGISPLMNSTAMIAVAAGPAVAIVPVATPALTPVPVLHGQTPAPIAHMPIPPDTFNGAMSIHTTQLPILPDSFNGAASMHMIQPTIAPDAFINANISGQLPAPAQFIGTTAMAAEMPILSPAAFANIAPSAVMPTPINFENINVASMMPQITVPNAFNNVEASAQMPANTDFSPIRAGELTLPVLPANAFSGVNVNSVRLMQPAFGGIKTEGVTSQALRADNFTGAMSISSIEQPVKPSEFTGVKMRAVLPVSDALIFKNMDAGREVKVMFPDGSRTIPTYALGIPLGAEKPLMEPKIKEENKR
ncbi:MAG: hypothetical protein NT036_04635, partial [Candidatus Omnitrophica bacterium]|nr:hypothetical protein [Candidatus Omnitrophota bacterium]